MTSIRLSACLLATCLLAAACQPQGDAPTAAQPPADDALDTGPASADAPATAGIDDVADDVPALPEHPALRVETLDHGTYDVADRRGSWVVVNFWATWCAPCLKEMPELSALDAMNEQVEVIGLAYEEIDEAAMRAFLEQRPVVYPIAIVDTYAPPADFETPRGLPMTYLLDPEGRIAERFMGPVTAADIEAAIAAAGARAG